MNISFEIWKALAGIAIFLVGMRLLEDSLSKLASRSFKLFLKKQTSNRLKGVLGGTLLSAVLQSSSVLNLMVLAFVGAGIISMQNALSVILGANLGANTNSWIIALVAFKANIATLAYPIITFAGVGYFFFSTENRYHKWSSFFLGLGFILMGLDIIKNSMGGLLKEIDFSLFENQSILIFFFVGIIITFLAQTSSVTMALTLSALNVQVLSLYQALAIVLGGELGTTLKFIIAGISGTAAKKRVAFGNFFINLVTALIALIFLSTIKTFITGFLHINDDLMAVVVFQSLVNIGSILLFFPFLPAFGRFLEKRFQTREPGVQFIHKTPASDTNHAILAFEEESRVFLFGTLDFALNCFDLPGETIHEKKAAFDHGKTITEKYDHLKYLHGRIHDYYILMHETSPGDNNREKQNRLISSVRNGMYSAKNIKDALPDIMQLRNSSNDVKYQFYIRIRKMIQTFCKQLTGILEKKEDLPGENEMMDIFKSLPEQYTLTLEFLYHENTAGQVNATEITTLINFNRQIFIAFKSLSIAVKDFFLNKEQSKYFDELPGFIR